jgi:hypothetical protein
MQWAVVSLRFSPTRACLLRRIQEDSPEKTVVAAAVMVAVLWIWRQVDRGE